MWNLYKIIIKCLANRHGWSCFSKSNDLLQNVSMHVTDTSLCYDKRLKNLYPQHFSVSLSINLSSCQNMFWFFSAHNRIFQTYMNESLLGQIILMSHKSIVYLLLWAWQYLKSCLMEMWNYWRQHSSTDHCQFFSQKLGGGHCQWPWPDLGVNQGAGNSCTILQLPMGCSQVGYTSKWHLGHRWHEHLMDFHGNWLLDLGTYKQKQNNLTLKCQGASICG